MNIQKRERNTERERDRESSRDETESYKDGNRQTTCIYTYRQIDRQAVKRTSVQTGRKQRER